MQKKKNLSKFQNFLKITFIILKRPFKKTEENFSANFENFLKTFPRNLVKKKLLNNIKRSEHKVLFQIFFFASQLWIFTLQSARNIRVYSRVYYFFGVKFVSSLTNVMVIVGKSCSLKFC